MNTQFQIYSLFIQYMTLEKSTCLNFPTVKWEKKLPLKSIIIKSNDVWKFKIIFAIYFFIVQSSENM